MFFFLNVFLKLFFLLTPFFVLTMFLSMTPGWERKNKTILAFRVGMAVFLISLAVFFFGHYIFQAFGFTIDAFRIGGGVILFLSAIGLVNGNVLDKRQGKPQNTPLPPEQESDPENEISKIATVPLAIPVTVGPATIAALMIASAESLTFYVHAVYFSALFVASLILTCMLLLSTWIEEKIGIHAILVFSKLTGLILAAMASQMIFTGFSNLWIALPK